MGVYRFGSEFISPLPRGKGKPKPTTLLPKVIHYHLIDINGMLYPIADRVFACSDTSTEEEKKIAASKTREELMKLYKQELFNDLDGKFYKINACKGLVLAVDGVAPAAKINQQRERRYVEGCEPDNDSQTVGGYPPVFGGSLEIMPGTLFMETVHGYLSEYVSEREGKIVPKIIYSSYLDRGEGEHKLFHIAEDLNKEALETEVYAVDGLDSDLVSLAIVRPFRVILFRSRDKDDFVDIDELKVYVHEKFRTNQRNLNKTSIIYDFVLLLFMFGNDFMPRTPFAVDIMQGFNVLVDAHRELRTTIVDQRRNINWNALGTLFYKVGRIEAKEMLGRSLVHYKYPHPVYHSASIVELGRRYMTTDGDTSKSILKDYDKTVRRQYYEHVLLPRSEIGRRMLDLPSFDMNNRRWKSEVFRFSRDYCHVIEWNFKYYTTRYSLKTYLYKHIYAPMLLEVSNYLQNEEHVSIFKEIDQPMGITAHKLSVIPPKYAKMYVEKPYVDAMFGIGKIHHLCPVGFPTLREGIKEEKFTFMQKKMLPMIDVELINDVALNRNGTKKMSTGGVKKESDMARLMRVH